MSCKAIRHWPNGVSYLKAGNTPIRALGYGIPKFPKKRVWKSARCQGVRWKSEHPIETTSKLKREKGMVHRPEDCTERVGNIQVETQTL